MAVETALYPSQLNTNWPTAADMVSEGDDHLRLIKTVDKTTWPNVAGAVSASHIELNYLVGVTSGIQAQLNAKGSIAGQTWSGAHSFGGSIAVPTVAASDNTTSAASTAFVQANFLQKFPNYTTPVNASSTELNYLVGLTGAIQPQLSNQVSGPIHAAVAKNTPADADELGITDSAASWALKNLTFANLAAWIRGIALTGLSTATNAAITSADTVLTAFGKLQKQITDLDAAKFANTGGNITGNVLLTSTGALGYGTGAGGTAIQPTDKSTSVTLNKPSGIITLNSASLAAGASVNFGFLNSYLNMTDGLIVHANGFTGYSIELSYFNSDGNAVLKLTNNGATRSDAVLITFRVIKGASS